MRDLRRCLMFWEPNRKPESAIRRRLVSSFFLVPFQLPRLSNEPLEESSFHLIRERSNFLTHPTLKLRISIEQSPQRNTLWAIFIIPRFQTSRSLRRWLLSRIEIEKRKMTDWFFLEYTLKMETERRMKKKKIFFFYLVVAWELLQWNWKKRR